MEEFINPLSAEEIAKIYEFYKMDFAILGYAKMDNPKFPYIDLEQMFWVYELCGHSNIRRLLGFIWTDVLDQFT